MIIILTMFLAAAGTGTSSKEKPKQAVQQNSFQSDWKKVLEESNESAKKIQNYQERKKLLRLIQSLQQTSQYLLTTDTSKDNCFLAEQQRQQWQALINELTSRINLTESSMKEGQDRSLIVQVLQNLKNEASKKNTLPDKCSKQSETQQSSLAYFHESKELYAQSWLEYNLNEVKKLLGDFSPSVFISHAPGSQEQQFAEKLSDHLKMAGIDAQCGQKKDEREEPDFFIVIGSKRYGDHYQKNRLNAELQQIEARYKQKPGHIISILMSDDPMEAFPPYLKNQVFADFSDSDIYHHQLGMVILALCRHADESSGIKRLLQSTVEGTYCILNLSEDELATP